jgi:gamma-glutamyltranspeptidase / glutathione hydrolase
MMTFQWTDKYPSVRIPVFARNVVSTSHPLAAQAGLRMLLKGGSAVDAAIAGGAMLTIVEPVSCGLGGDAFAIVWDGSRLHGLNSAGVAPAAWNLDYFNRKYPKAANGFASNPKRGWDTVTVPGVVAGWMELHKKFGKLPLEEVLAPAIDIAESGHAVAPIVAHKWAAAIPELEGQPGFRETFMPNGRALSIGECFTFRAAAETLRRIAKSAGRDFYEGETAHRIAQFSKETGGSLTLDDLASYRSRWVDPIHAKYEGHDVYELPPSGQGIAALMALRMIEMQGISAFDVDSVDGQHLQIEAMKIAFSDVYRYVADPYAMSVSTADMLSDGYLAERAKLINMKTAMRPVFGMPRSGGTIYLSAADSSGMMISFIQSNYLGFGSGVVVPDLGVSLQNRGFGFSMDPASPNVVEGGKQPFHTIIPGFLMKNDQPVMSFGVMGGDMQPQAHVQTLIRMLTYRQQPQSACDAPRWKLNRDFTLDVEGSMSNDLVTALSARGHQLKSIEDPYMDFGSGQFIWRLSGPGECGYLAASDSRRDGQAVGF